MNKKRPAQEEYVMVFPTEILHEVGYFQGISFDIDKYLNSIFNNLNYKFLLRKDAESDPNYKQLIPYIILKCGSSLFVYRRGELLEEKRLLGNYSIGLGGHISIPDDTLFDMAYDDAVERELTEEVSLEADYRITIRALINDDTNDVGKVHFGIIHVAELEYPLVEKKEKSINEGKFVDIYELKSDLSDFENWSIICIENMDNILG